MSWVDIKTEALLKCKRHCCICEQFKGNNIEVHHIVHKNEGGKDEFDNAIPLCFDCHALIGSYNPNHPKGNKYTIKELKRIRDDFYIKVQNMSNFNSTNKVNINNEDYLRTYWLQLSECMEKYHFCIEYAYDFWKTNFKTKYQRINNDTMFNYDYESFQEEIDRYGDSLYAESLNYINESYYNNRKIICAVRRTYL